VGAPDYIKNKIIYPITINQKVKLKNKQFNKSFYFQGQRKISTLSSNHINGFTKIETLGPYLAGLWEGDGHICIPNKKSIEKGKKENPYLAITFPIKDEPLVIHFKNLLGGRIRYKYEDNALVWIIGSREKILNFVNLINGYLRTPKIFEFNQLISFLNNKYNLNIKENISDSSKLSDNGWLSGFFDADGGFKIRYTEKLLDNKLKVIRKGRIEVRVSIEQRQYHPKTNMPFIDIMKSIANFFTLDSENTTHLRTSIHNGKNYWIIEVTSLSKLIILVNYLNKYPLLTSKHNDYKDWLIVYNMMLNKDHLNTKGKDTIKNIKFKINKNRTNFDWNHIENIIK
jgi:hypothetical protein